MSSVGYSRVQRELLRNFTEFTSTQRPWFASEQLDIAAISWDKTTMSHMLVSYFHYPLLGLNTHAVKVGSIAECIFHFTRPKRFLRYAVPIYNSLLSASLDSNSIPLRVGHSPPPPPPLHKNASMPHHAHVHVCVSYCWCSC